LNGIAIDMFKNDDLIMVNIHGAPPPNGTPEKQSIDPLQTDHTCTADSTKKMASSEVVALVTVVENGYGKANRLFNKHHENSKLCNPWHPV
jgi:hypothetical protein